MKNIYKKKKTQIWALDDKNYGWIIELVLLVIYIKSFILENKRNCLMIYNL